MKTNIYTYCILKYKHSPFLDESINIGVLIYFEDSRKFVFKFSKTLNRIKNIYNNVPEKTIKEYLRQINKYLDNYQGLEENFFPLNDLNLKSFLAQNVLPSDSSVLQFSHFKTDYLRDFSEDFIEKVILDKVFIDDIKSNQTQQQEPKIISHLFQELKKQGFEELANKNRVQKDFNIKTNTGNFNFDFAWKNGVWNLVKPIGFDLKTGDGILQKARNNLGEFIDLESEVKSQYKCALIVGKPSDRTLYQNYTKALKILHKLPETITIVEEKDIRDYSHHILQEISKPS